MSGPSAGRRRAPDPSSQFHPGRRRGETELCGLSPEWSAATSGRRRRSPRDPIGSGRRRSRPKRLERAVCTFRLWSAATSGRRRSPRDPIGSGRRRSRPKRLERASCTFRLWSAATSGRRRRSPRIRQAPGRRRGPLASIWGQRPRMGSTGTREESADAIAGPQGGGERPYKTGLPVSGLGLVPLSRLDRLATFAGVPSDLRCVRHGGSSGVVSCICQAALMSCCPLKLKCANCCDCTMEVAAMQSCAHRIGRAVEIGITATWYVF